VNVNDRNGILKVLHLAFSTGKTIVLDNPRVSAEELIEAAEELKGEHRQFEPVRVRKAGPHRVALELGERQTALVDCPDCGTHIALLPSELYTSTQDVDPGVMVETESGQRDAMFAIVDADGRYVCPNPDCQYTGKV
jgi:hypothetical protein